MLKKLVSGVMLAALTIMSCGTIVQAGGNYNWYDMYSGSRRD